MLTKEKATSRLKDYVSECAEISKISIKDGQFIITKDNKYTAEITSENKFKMGQKFIDLLMKDTKEGNIYTLANIGHELGHLKYNEPRVSLRKLMRLKSKKLAKLTLAISECRADIHSASLFQHLSPYDKYTYDAKAFEPKSPFAYWSGYLRPIFGYTVAKNYTVLNTYAFEDILLYFNYQNKSQITKIDYEEYLENIKQELNREYCNDHSEDVKANIDYVADLITAIKSY